MTAKDGAVSVTSKHGLPIEADPHVHKPCGHKCRCNSSKGGCQKCARDRHNANPFVDLSKVYGGKK